MLNIVLVSYLAHLFFMNLTPLYGHYRMIRYKALKLSYGPQFVLGGLHILAWILNGEMNMISYYTWSYSFLLIHLIYLWSYLGITKQWAQFVYQDVILINISYYIRQKHLGLEPSIAVIDTLYMLAPVYAIVQTKLNRSMDFISKWNITFGILDALCHALHLSLVGWNALAAVCFLKIAVLLLQLYQQKQLRKSIEKEAQAKKGQ